MKRLFLGDGYDESLQIQDGPNFSDILVSFGEIDKLAIPPMTLTFGVYVPSSEREFMFERHNFPYPLGYSGKTRVRFRVTGIVAGFKAGEYHLKGYMVHVDADRMFCEPFSAVFDTNKRKGRLYFNKYIG